MNSLLVLVGPDVDDEDHRKEDAPTCKGSGTPAETSIIQNKTDHPRTDDLGKPVHEVIQRSCANVEQGRIIVVEFCRICFDQSG